MPVRVSRAAAGSPERSANQRTATISATAPRTNSSIVSALTRPFSPTALRRPGRCRSGDGADRLAAPLLGRHVAQGLGELPAVPGEVGHRALALAVLPVDRPLQHPGPDGAGTGELGVDVGHPQLELVGDLAVL